MIVRTRQICLMASSLLAVVLFVSLAGCGAGDTGPVKLQVTGQVTLDGEPVAEGEIIFSPVDGTGHRHAGRIIDGSYELESTAGKKKVEITAYRDSKDRFDESNPGERVPIREQFIPENYNAQTTLTVEVEDSSGNRHDFQLQSNEGG